MTKSKAPLQSGQLVVTGVKIAQDKEGRYRLNDLHKASGGNAKHKPSNWIRLEETKELVMHVEKRCSHLSNAIELRKGGQGQGTYVRKELVYAYAMWISPVFHLHVIDTFDALVTGQLEQAKADAEAKANRERARLEASVLTDAVKFSREAEGKEAKFYNYVNEFELINRIALSCSTSQFRKAHGLRPGAPIRDKLTPEQIKAVERLQQHNTTMIGLGMPREERKEKLQQFFAIHHLPAISGETGRLCA